jgi:hypothetical protein
MEKQSLLFESGVHSKDQIIGKLVKKNEERERKIKNRERKKEREKGRYELIFHNSIYLVL